MIPLLVPGAAQGGHGQRRLRVHAGANKVLAVDQVVPDGVDRVALDPAALELPSSPPASVEEIYPEAVALLRAATPADVPPGHIEWLLAELLLDAPDLTLETDDVDASAGFEPIAVEVEAPGTGVDPWIGRGLVARAGTGLVAVEYEGSTHRVYLASSQPPSPDTPWDRWPLPRLETKRSLRVAASRAAGRPIDYRLDQPGVTRQFWWRYSLTFLQNEAYRATAKRFLGPDRMPGGVYAPAFLRMDDSRTVEGLWERPAFERTPPLSRRDPALADGDAWLVDRVLNGLHPCLFFEEAGSDGDPRFAVEFRWDDYTFSPVAPKPWDVHVREDETAKRHYELPNVRASFVRSGRTLAPESITITHRKLDAGPGAAGEPLRGPVTDASQLEPARTYTPAHPAWSYAKRVLRCQLALAGEIDVHLSRAHVLVEQYYAALASSPGLEHGAFFALVEPHLRDVDDINAFGEVLIFGATGVLSNASALSETGVMRRFLDQLGGLDWKGWSPRRPICDAHVYARAANAFWHEVLVPTVRRHFEAHADDLQASWPALLGFSHTLSRRSPRFRPYLGVHHDSAAPRWHDTSELVRERRPPDAPSLSPLPEHFDLAALTQLACHAIHHATFVHTWANDRQFDDLGDPRFASLGLMARDEPSRHAPYREGHDAAWEARAEPLLRDSAFTMTLARVLSHLDVGYFLSRREGCSGRRHRDSPVRDELRGALRRARDSYHRAAEHDPFAAERSEKDRVRVCDLRSHVNT